jgi:hypothetical protein
MALSAAIYHRPWLAIRINTGSDKRRILSTRPPASFLSQRTRPVSLMMFVADPSSCCDVCYSVFSTESECYCIPVVCQLCWSARTRSGSRSHPGHVFCQPYLLLPQMLECPMCRTHINSWSRIRKVIVGWGTGSGNGPHNQTARPERELEEELAREAGSSLGLARAVELCQKVDDFVAQRPDDDVRVHVGLLRTSHDVSSYSTRCSNLSRPPCASCTRRKTS